MAESSMRCARPTRCPAFFRRCWSATAGWSTARAFGAEIVIAANVSSDVFAHGTTVYSHGPVAGAAVAEATEPEPEAPKRGLRQLFSPERTMKREFFGSAERPGISSVMLAAFNLMKVRITRAR